MAYPSRGCRTCKQRRVKCDEGQPICKRCQKANVPCEGIHGTGNLLFVDENDYAVGRRKRPRGPNIRSSQGAKPNLEITRFDDPLVSPILRISQPLNVPLEDQAINYYSTYYCDVPHDWPEIVDNHLMFALANFQPQSQSILSFAIHAVSHATFGRARRNKLVLAVAGTQYSKALAKINAALRDPNLVTHDETLLSAMLLSFYENSVTDRRSLLTNRGLKLMAARSFAHHDGGMAMLKLRRQLKIRTEWGLRLDKLSRRQLVRSLMLRSLPVPAWLRDGSKYGETGLALKFDRFSVIAAKLRHEVGSLLAAGSISLNEPGNIEKLRYLLVEAQKLDDALALWAYEVPREDWYGSQMLQSNELVGAGSRIFSENLHIYPTVGHAGMWNRYRGVRLVVNDVILKTLHHLSKNLEPETEILEAATRTRIQVLAEEFCASVPYVLGLVEKLPAYENGVAVVKAPTSLKIMVKASKAALLCWPLTITTLVEIPERHGKYLKARLLDVSELVDDGLLERVATG